MHDHEHDVVNLGGEEAISIHVYSPPLRATDFRTDAEIILSHT